jgi:predicted GNAT family acetyltransferase
VSSSVTDNAAESRFELEEQGEVAFADYRRRGEVLVIPHVEAPMALRGTGAAARLMEGALEIVRQRGEKVIPTCSYAAAYIRRHKQWQDLLA